MNSILKNKKFENIKNLFIVCYDDSQEACVLEAIENCNEGFKWHTGDCPTRYKSKYIFVREYFNYGKCSKYNRYIICIDLKTKQLSYICDDEELVSLRRCNYIIGKDYLNYLANEFLDVIKVKSILDDKEKEYLSAVIRPFKDRVLSFSKLFQCAHEFKCELIKIKVQGGVDTHIIETIYLPYFEKETMYKNMILNKEYTLKELDLD